MNRVHNFCAGPCTLPLSVLEELQANMVEFGDAGMSLIEMSHRSKGYDEVHQGTLALLRELCEVPEDMEVLLLQGGASLQFAMVAMNLLVDERPGGYVRSGSWANKAHGDAQKVTGPLGPVNTYAAWDGSVNLHEGHPNARMPLESELDVRPDTRYIHVTTNETIGGLRLGEIPDLEVPLVADMSSEYLSRPIPWDRVDLAYGGVQKNLGPAGLAVVFARPQLLDEAPVLPSYLSYKAHAEADSLANTPPMFAVWAMGLVLEWIKERGGLLGMEHRAAERSGVIYEALDSAGGFYRTPVRPSDRSHMNIVFRIGADDEAASQLEPLFLAQAESRGLMNLAGHRSVGGMRASCYNALPDEAVEALRVLLSEFVAAHG
jgi:phosphoserine aminotransferase